MFDNKIIKNRYQPSNDKLRDEQIPAYEGQATEATVNATNLKHANLIDFRNNFQRVELVAMLQCGSQRRDPGLSDDVSIQAAESHSS